MSPPLVNPSIQQVDIRSLDFDGCIFNEDYHIAREAALKEAREQGRSLTVEEELDLIAKYNKSLFVSILEDLMNYPGEMRFVIGSNRQSPENDKFISLNHKTPSCFFVLSKIKDILQRVKEKSFSIEEQSSIDLSKVSYNTFLTSDIFGYRSNGESITNALKEKEEEKAGSASNKKKYDHPEAFIDESKFILLYAQMHHFASENPNNEYFDFYDDRTDILNPLASFFKANPDLMPRNLKFRLHQYNGKLIEDYEVITGAGPIDYNYKHNSRYLIECAGITNYHDEINVLKNLDEEKLEKFKSNRVCLSTPGEYLTELEKAFNNLPEGMGGFKIALGNLISEIRISIEDIKGKPISTEMRQSLALQFVLEILHLIDALKQNFAPIEFKYDPARVGISCLPKVKRAREAAINTFENNCLNFKFSPRRINDFVNPAQAYVETEYYLTRFNNEINLLGNSDEKSEAKTKFVATLKDLFNRMDKGLKKLNGMKPKEIQESAAYQITQNAITMLDVIHMGEVKMGAQEYVGDEAKIKAVEWFANTCDKHSNDLALGKLLAAVVITACCFILGASIGFLVGLGTGPGAAFSTVMGGGLGLKIGLGLAAAAFPLATKSLFKKTDLREKLIQVGVAGKEAFAMSRA